jgi:hypothetical protein
MAIGAEESNAIAGLDAMLAQGTRKTADTIGKLRVRKPVVVADHGGPAGKLLPRVAKET